MARVTVEDCARRVPDRFELVMLTARRCHDIAAGESLLVERDRDKDSVVALREIAEGLVRPEDLQERLIRSMQKYAPSAVDDVE